jgi:GTPase
MDDFDDVTGAQPGGPKPYIDRQEQPTRTGLVCPDVRGKSSYHSIDARQAEFEGLAGAIRLDVIFSDVVKVREIRPATYIGAGHVEALAAKVKAEQIELLLVDAPLTPIQQRNLERETGTKVLDRTALILEIFGERAATREGVLQVELAHLNYQKGRLVRSWTHL